MVVSNPEPESNGGREGLLALVAIAVVLFFVIRIYADYVTATGQAVKPGQARRSTSIAQSRGEFDSEDAAPVRHTPRARYRVPQDDPPSDRRTAPVEPESDSTEEAPAPPARERPAPQTGDYFASMPAEHVSKSAFPGQIVIERARPAPAPELQGRVIARRGPRSAPPRPRPLDGPDMAEDEGTVQTVLASGPRARLFGAKSPYPRTYDDLQIGDRLSEITKLALPGGRLSRSVYSYRPEGGPFKKIVAMLSVGPADPTVTGVVYLFRSPLVRGDVQRQAVRAFGEGEAALTDQGERREWRHLDGSTVAVERDRYTVDEDMTVEGRRLYHRSTSKTTE
jgi:hypothetical protein